jgi:hypothetical protein
MMTNEVLFVFQPDGTADYIVGGSLTLDNSNVPYATAIVTIDAPDDISQFDPRTRVVGGLPVAPRIQLYWEEDFSHTGRVSDLSVFAGSYTVSNLSTLWGAATVADRSANFTLANYNKGTDWQSRRNLYKTANLGITSRTLNPDGTLTLELSSDETYLFGLPPVSLNYLAVQILGIRTLRELITYYLTLNLIGAATYSPRSTPGPNTTDFAFPPSPTHFDYDITAALPSDPSAASVIATGDLWDTLDTFVQLAGARLWCDENRVWHLEDASIGQAPPTPPVVYSQGFETSTDSWIASGPAGAGATRATGVQHRNGVASLAISRSALSGVITTKRTITGLNPGQIYTFTAWSSFIGSALPVIVSIGVTGIGASPVLTSTHAFGPLQWSQLSYTFTATSSSQELFLTNDYQGAGSGNPGWYWDDIAVVAQQIDLNLSGSSTTDFSDTLNRLGDWYSAVVIQYSWTTPDNKTHGQTDTAVGVGTVPQRYLYVQKDNTVFPGFGAAQAILNRVSLYGHEVSITALNEFDTLPGDVLSVTTPAGTYTGVASAVTFDFIGKTMTVTSRNLS